MAVGARFSDRSTGRISGFAPNAKIAHIDIDPASISKNVPIDIPGQQCRQQQQEGLFEFTATELDTIRAPILWSMVESAALPD